MTTRATNSPVQAKPAAATAIKTANVVKPSNSPVLTQAPRKVSSGMSSTYPAKAGVKSIPKNSFTVGKKSKNAGGIPKSAPSQGLSAKKSSKEKTQDQIQARLKKKSPWFTSIKSPLTNAGVKIPDSTGVETGTLQSVTRAAIVSNDDGCCSIRIVSPYPNTQGGPAYCVNFSTDDGTSTPLSTKWSTTYTSADNAFPSSDDLQAFSTGVRVVSAALYVQSEAALVSNGGIMIGYTQPFPVDLTASTTPSTSYENLYKSVIVPINNNKPVEVMWYPIAKDGFRYDTFTNPVAAIDTADATAVPLYEMGVVIVGAFSVPGTGGIEFQATMVVNYEFIPTSNVANIVQSSPSPQDAQEVDLVENWVQDLPVVSMVPSQKVAVAPASSIVDPPGDESGFGMFFEVLKEIAPMAIGALF
jgi:hypothetical protein